MATIPFRERLAQDKPLLADGAMGTTLHTMGMKMDVCFDALNLTDPALVASVHRSYLEAGAEIIETNTFSANPYKLSEFNLQKKTIEINEAGVELARRVIDASFRKDVYLAGAVGPLGVYLAPFGRVREEDAYRAFRKQIGAMIRGIDLLVLETFSDLPELAIAFKVARDLNPDIPILVSTTYTRDDRTLMGDTPVNAARYLSELKPDIIGINCSSGPAQLRRLLLMMKNAVPDAKFSVMPNAGWPETVGGRVIYPSNMEYFGEYALAFAEAGATIIGGCCGTTPEHIGAMREALDDEKRTHSIMLDPIPDEAVNGNGDTPEAMTQLQQKLAVGNFVVTVEMSPPRGFVTQKVVAAAEMLRSAGVDTINVSDSPMARMRMSPWATAHLIQDRVGIETVLHFPTRGRNMLRVQGDLLAAHALGVRNIFVVMGDPTHIGDYPDAFNTQDVVPSGLVHIIKQQLNKGLDQAGNSITQPTSFFVGTALNLNRPELEKEIELLRKKIDAGADYALSQPIYDPAIAERFLKRYEEIEGQPVPIPILVGLLPLHNDRHAAFLQHEVPGIHIPESQMERIAGADDQAAEGVKMAQELLLDLKDLVQGTYLMPPFGKYHLAAEVVDVLAIPTL